MIAMHGNKRYACLAEYLGASERAPQAWLKIGNLHIISEAWVLQRRLCWYARNVEELHRESNSEYMIRVAIETLISTGKDFRNTIE